VSVLPPTFNCNVIFEFPLLTTSTTLSQAKQMIGWISSMMTMFGLKMLQQTLEETHVFFDMTVF